ncbi:hypothetical protein FRC07_009884, partial [Ceratobasidium sp. 392]
CLERQQQLDKNLNKLIESITGIKPSIESVKEFAGNSLEETVKAMLKVIEDVLVFICYYKSCSPFGMDHFVAH